MKNDRGSMNWKEFEKKMIEQFPFLPKDFTNGDLNPNASSWVSDYVQKQIQRALPADLNIFSNRPLLSYDVQETHRHIFARVRLPKQISPYQVGISVTQNMLRIKPPTGKKQDIYLRKQVDPKRTRAKFKGGILEIQMPIVRKPKRYHEVYVEEG